MERAQKTMAMGAAAFGAAVALAATMGACAPAPQSATVGSVWVKADPDATADAADDRTAEDQAPTTAERKTFVGTDVGEGFPASSYLSVEDLNALIAAGEAYTVVDIRSLKSYAGLHAEGTLNIPENQIPFRSDEISGDGLVVLIADTGNTLEKARQYLLDAGFDDAQIKALDGGMATIWSVTGMKMESGSLEAYAC